MNAFVQQHAKSVSGILRGWDRLRFRGTVRMLAHLTGMKRFLECTRHRFKEFGEYAQQVSRQVRSASLEVAEAAGRPVVHLDSPVAGKEQIALEIARRDGIEQGLIAVVTAVESCNSYDVRSDRSRGILQLYLRHRKCQHLYHYMIHPVSQQVNPALEKIIGRLRIGYYWSLDQSEWASDVMFKDREELDRLYPDLVRHAMESFRSPQVMSFLGRRVDKGITPRFSGQVLSDLHRRIEGTRVKHCVNRNSVKMYNKAGSILRVETTLNDMERQAGTRTQPAGIRRADS